MKDKPTYEELEKHIAELKKQNEILQLSVNSDKNNDNNQLLKESEEKYIALYINSSLPSQSLDKNGCFIDINRMWLKTLGYEKNEVLGNWFGDYLHPDSVEHFKINFPKFIKHGYLSDVEFQIKKKDGTFVFATFEGCIGYTPEGIFKQTYSVLKDITEQKEFEIKLTKAKEKAEESEEKFKLLNHLTSEMLLLQDLESIYKFVADNLQKYYPNSIVLYVSIDESNNQTWLEAVSGLDNNLLMEVKKILGYNAVGRMYELRDLHYNYFRSGNFIEFEGDLAEFSASEFSISGASDIEKLIDLHKIYTIGINKEDELLAAIHFFTFNKQVITDSSFIEVFVKQAGLVLQEKINEKALIKAKIKAEESEKALNEAQVLAQVGSWEIKFDTRLLTWSDELYRIFEIEKGLSSDEFRSIYRSRLHPDDLDFLDRITDSSTLSGEKFQHEYRLIFDDGTRIKYVRAIGSESKKDLNGKTVSFHGTFQDLTEQKLIEIELIKAKEKAEEIKNRLKLATKSGQLGVWDWNVKENVMFWDERMFELYGISKDAFVDTIDAWTNGLHPDDKQDAINESNAALNGEKEYDSTFRVVHPDGTILYLKGEGLVIRDSENKPVRMIGINKDITKDKLIEEELIAAKEKAEKNEARFKNMFEHHNAIMLLIEPETGQIIDANISAVNYYGYDKAKLCSIKMDDINTLTMEQLSIERQKAIDGRRNHFNFTHKLANGEERFVEVHSSPIEFQDKKILFSIIYDVTERKLTEESLAQEKIFIEALLESVPGYLYVYNDQGNLIRWNKKHETMTGYSAEELSQMNMSDWFEGDDAVRVAAAVEDVMTKGYGEVEANLLIKGGEKILIHSNGVRLDLNGKTFFTGVGIDITQSKLAETKLKKSEEEYRLLAENSSDAIWVLNLTQDRFTYISPAMYRLSGFTVEEALQEKLRNVLAPESIERINKQFKTNVPKFIKNPDNPLHTISEVQQIHKNGSLIWVEASSRYRMNESGEIELVGVSRNIESRKHAEESLRISEAKYRELFEANKDGISIFYVNPDESFSNFVEMNNASFEMLGYTKEEFENLSVTDLEVFQNKADLQDKKQQIFENGFAAIETKVRHKNGKKIDVEIKIIPLQYNNRFALMNIVRDITERKEFEVALQFAKEKTEESRQQLKLSEEKLRIKLDFILSPQTEIPNLSITDLIELKQLQEIQNAFASATGIASIITDTEGNPITTPSNFSGVCTLIRQTELGRKNCYKSDKTIGQNAAKYKKPNFEQCHSCGFIDSGAPIFVGDKLIAIWMIGQGSTGKVDKTQILNYADEIGANKEKILFEYEKMNEMPLQKFQAITNLLWIFAQELSSFAYNNLVLAKKIEEQKEYEINLFKAKEKAEESDRLKSAFLANMSHEIRTPMNGILGFAELLKEPDLSGEEQQEYIDIIEKSGERMLNIINDIINISKIEAGLMEVQMQETNINEQLEYIYTFFKPEIEGKGMKLSFKNSLPFEKAILKTDREKVYAILTNLVKNAIKYSEKGTIEFGYVLKKDTGLAELEFFVKDTGIGIPKNRQEAIFERFIQADINDKMARQGAGLGLSISKAYIEMLGGKIWVESEEGVGSTFYFTLPCQCEETEKNAKNEDSTSVEAISLKKLKILIAEDDPTSEMLLSHTVQKLANEIILARTGTEAVEICFKYPEIDVVLMDIMMPEMDGYEATRQIRMFNKDIIIIAQTAYALEGDKEKAIVAGCNDYITKPIKKEELTQLIIKCMNK